MLDLPFCDTFFLFYKFIYKLEHFPEILSNALPLFFVIFSKQNIKKKILKSQNVNQHQELKSGKRKSITVYNKQLDKCSVPKTCLLSAA